ncbi:hypothetical protein MMC11_005865 [Xylographa trunciseda]|nr:hypothetical protein [Xylographa trunciseda]
MDPLSLTASILAVLTAAGTVASGLKKLQSLKHASDDFLALMTEVSDLQLVLESVNDAIRAQGESGRHLSTSLAKLLLRAKTTLIKLNKIIQKRLTKTQTTSQNELKVARLAWIIKRSAVRILQEELRDIRLNLTTALASGNSVGISRIDIKVNEVSFLASELKQRQEENHKETSLVLVQQAAMLEDLYRTLAADSAVGQAGPIMQLGNQVVPEVSDGTIDVKSATPNSDTERSSYFHTIRIIVSRTASDGCSPFCSCVCHARVQMRTPSILHYLVGSLFISYSGFPGMTSDCDERSCSRQMKATGQFSYYFPTWLLARAFMGNITPAPETLLRVVKVIPSRSSIFHHAMLGNVDDIKKLFAKGLASPFDVAESGSSVLHLTDDSLHSTPPDLTFANSLLDSKADPFYQCRQDSRPIDLAWDRVLGNFESESTEETLINESLEGSTSEIDSTDSSDRSALSWAAMRADTPAVTTLLRHKAHADSRDPSGKTALHYARTDSITSLLLAHNARADARDVYGRTACRRAPDLPRITALPLAGADIHAPDNWRRTPLSHAAQFDCPLVGARLLPATPEPAGLRPRRPRRLHPAADRHREQRPRDAPPPPRARRVLHVALRSADPATLLLLARDAPAHQLPRQRRRARPRWRSRSTPCSRPSLATAGGRLSRRRSSAWWWRSSGDEKRLRRAGWLAASPLVRRHGLAGSVRRFAAWLATSRAWRSGGHHLCSRPDDAEDSLLAKRGSAVSALIRNGRAF